MAAQDGLLVGEGEDKDIRPILPIIALHCLDNLGRIAKRNSEKKGEIIPVNTCSAHVCFTLMPAGYYETAPLIVNLTKDWNAAVGNQPPHHPSYSWYCCANIQRVVVFSYRQNIRAVARFHNLEAFCVS